MTDLARKLAAHPRWQWMPGMLAHLDGVVTRHPYRIAWVCMNKVCTASGPGTDLETCQLQAAIPDLDDPATVGCLWPMLVEAMGEDMPVLVPLDTVDLEPAGWGVSYRAIYPSLVTSCKTRGIAIATALSIYWGDGDD